MIMLDVTQFIGNVKFAIYIPEFGNKCKKVKIFLF